jgi:predicted transcriptional regulator
MFSEQTQESAISTREILEAVSNDTSLRLLDFIAGDHRLNTEDLLNQLSITRKQYYMRTSKFVDSGLIRRIGNRYFLTSFGSVIYELYSILREVINRKV